MIVLGASAEVAATSAPPRPKAAVFTSDGKTILAGWTDGSITATSVASGEARALPLSAGQAAEINFLALSGDDTRLVATTATKLKVYDLAGGRLLFERPLDPGNAGDRDLQISPDGREALVRYRYGAGAMLIDLKSGDVHRLSSQYARGPAFAGNLVLTYEETGLHVWNLDGSSVRVVRAPYLLAAALLSSGRLLVAQVNRTNILDLATGAISPVTPHVPLSSLTRLDHGTLVGTDRSRWYLIGEAGSPTGGPYAIEQGNIGITYPAGERVLFWSVQEGLLTVTDPAAGTAVSRLHFSRYGRPLAGSRNGLFAMPSARAILIYDAHFPDRLPTCVAITDLAEQCRYAGVLRRFSDGASSAPLDDARTLIGRLRRRNPATLEAANEGSDYLAAAQRLLDGGATADARDAFIWLTRSVDSRTRLRASLGFASASDALGDHAGAQIALTALIGQMKRELASDTCLYCDAERQLATSYLASKDFPAALRAIDAAIHIAESTINLSPEVLAGDVAIRAEILAASGRSDEALQARSRAVSILRARQDLASLQVVADSKLAIGELMAEQGQPKQGDATATEGVDAVASLLDPSHPLLLDLRRRLGQLRLRIDEPQSALAPLRAAARAIRASSASPSGDVAQHSRQVFELQLAADWASAQAATAAGSSAAAMPPPKTAPNAPLPPRHGAAIKAVVVSPDGRLIASADWDGVIILWNAQTGAALLRLKASDDFHVARLVFSEDGSTISAVGDDATLFAWHVADGRKLAVPARLDVPVTVKVNGGYAIVEPDTRSIRFDRSGTLAMAESADGNTTAVTSWDDDKICVQGRAGQPRCGPHPGDKIGFELAGISASGDIVAITNDALFIFRADTLALRKRAPVQMPRQAISATTLTRNGQIVATAFGDGTLRLHDAATGRTLIDLVARPSPASALAFSRDGTQLVAGADDGSVLVWNVTNPAARLNMSVSEGPAHDQPIASIDISPNGRRVATADEGGTIRIWEGRTGIQTRSLSTGRLAASAAFATDNRLIATGATLQLIDVDTGAVLVRRAGSSAARTVVSSRTGISAVAEADGAVELLGPDGSTLHGIFLDGQPFIGLQISEDGRRLLTYPTGSQGATQLWDIGTGKLVRTLATHDESPRTAALTRTRLFVYAHYQLHVFDAVTGAPLGGPQDKECIAQPVAAGKLLALFEQKLCLVDDTASAMTKIGMPGLPQEASLAVSPTEGQVALGYDDGSVRLLDVATGKIRLASTQHLSRITALRFSRDGSILVSASRDRTADVIEAKTGALISILGR